MIASFLQRPSRRVLPVLLGLLSAAAPLARGESVARIWNDEILEAIRVDFPAPTVHSRNLFHLSVAMWDAWAAYDPVAVGYLHNEDATAADTEAARAEAISYAAYRILKHRYVLSINSDITLPLLDERMENLGYDPAFIFLLGDSPAAVGNRVADAIIAYGLTDGANEENEYVDDTGYESVNEPMILALNGTEMFDPNRWQPLAFDFALTQNGFEAEEIQTFVGPHWGAVKPFALDPVGPGDIYLDPGPPAMLGTDSDAEFKANSLEVIALSSFLDPDDGVMIDISPKSMGNNTLGENNGPGHSLNPATGQPYQEQMVKRGDFGRVVAEFWADGPASETPPGHWNTIANELVSDHPDFVKRLGGSGPVLNDLEWDVKLYLTLNGAVHDSAIAAWGCKSYYDYVRPISSIRYMGGLGQSSEPLDPFYHPNGLPLIPGLVEIVDAESSAIGERHEELWTHKGEIAIYAWGGQPLDPETQYSGSRWKLAIQWKPYQRSTFVTPAFAAYVSGHSCFSRASAEVLAAITGDPFFPGGLGEFVAHQDEYLEFEEGPTTDVRLQWGTYFDASDQSGRSRFWGGIHLKPDDGPGRIMGAHCGLASWEKAQKYFDGSILADRNFAIDVKNEGSLLQLTWPSVPGYYYKVECSTDLVNFSNLTDYVRATGLETSTLEFASGSETSRKYYRVVELQLQ